MLNLHLGVFSLDTAIIVHNNKGKKGSAEFLLDTNSGENPWYDAETILKNGWLK